MDKEIAARIIQRWFRSKFSKKECVISHSNFLSPYEVILDKQTYNANELLINLRHSSIVPHSRRELTESDVEYIHERFDPFDTSYRTHNNNRYYNDDLDDDEYEYCNNVNGCSPKPPISFILNKASILYVK
jgi:hypothetical protein